jgi:alcohol dehydrogenase, propanol-preferring
MIPKTMKAAVVEKFGAELCIREVPVPEPGPEEVLVEIVATGVCHTDLSAAEGAWPVKPIPPFIPGHEGAGWVVAAGSKVMHVKEGDRVGIPWLNRACGYCEYCLSGREMLCLRQQNSGYSMNGTFAEYAIGHGDYVAVIPPEVPLLDAAPILCAGLTTFKGLKETTTQAGQWVVISGIGGLGHVAVQYAKAMGFHVAAVDVGSEKMQLAKNLGAEIVIDASVQDPPTTIQQRIGGAQGVLVTAASSAAFKQALGMLRRGGTCVLLGLPRRELPVSVFDLVMNQQSIRGSVVGNRLDLQQALRCAAEGNVKATIETVPMESVNDVFARMKEGTVQGRVVLSIKEELQLKVEQIECAVYKYLKHNCAEELVHST